MAKTYPVTWHIQALIGKQWVWQKIETDTGNKYEAASQKEKELSAVGTKVSGWGMNHAYMVYN